MVISIFPQRVMKPRVPKPWLKARATYMMRNSHTPSLLPGMMKLSTA